MSPRFFESADEDAEEEAAIAEDYGAENVERPPSSRLVPGWMPLLAWLPRRLGRQRLSAAEALESADEKAEKSSAS